MASNNNSEWWNNQGGFFGSGYLVGDNSIEGYLPSKKETLEERTKREVDGIIKIINPERSDLILDVPCGYGRHTLELARRGYNVLGLDVNEEHLIIANQRKTQCKPGITSSGKAKFLREDMRKLNSKGWKNKAKTVLNMFYSFGFFRTDEENFGVMQGFYNCLNSEGYLLLHTDVSPEMIGSGHYRLNEKRNLREGGSLVIEEEYDEKTKRINGLWRIEDAKNVRTLTPYSVRIYSKEEFDEMARQAGFNGVDFYGSFDGEKFTSESKEMIMVAKK